MPVAADWLAPEIVFAAVLRGASVAEETGLRLSAGTPGATGCRCGCLSALQLSFLRLA